MPETLAREHRAEFSMKRIFKASLEVLRNRKSLGYTISAGLIGGAFLGYLNSAQQIFQEMYELHDLFAVFFAVIAFSLGLASFMNSQLVMRFGMQSMVNNSLRWIVLLALIGLIVTWFTNGHPPLWFLMAYLMSSFFGVGILFGNQNALAMQPLAHLAGIGAAVVGALSTLIQMPLGTIIGQNYNSTVFPMILGIGILAGISIFVVQWAESVPNTLH